MSKVSVIIPARNELYLTQTVADIYAKAVGEIEVIVILDGYWQSLPEYPKLTIIHWPERKGMRAAINRGTEAASGGFLLKCDAHCMFAPGFDEVLAAECADDWIVVPRREWLDAPNWKIREDHRCIDYEYLCWPTDPANHGMHAKYWWYKRQGERADILVDENMSFQGSCWFVHKAYFDQLLYPLQEEGYGTFIGEAVEIGLKVWLSGGKCMVNKKTWYAHLYKGQAYRDAYREKYGQAYTRISHSEFVNGNKFVVDYWMHNRWDKRAHDLSWLIERFWPVPTWPEDRNLWTP